MLPGQMEIDLPKSFLDRTGTLLSRYYRGFRKSFSLQLLVVPGLVYFIIFHYVPMYGVLIAFKNFKFSKGVLGSEWVGLYQFELFLSHPNFAQLVLNTLLLSVYALIWGFLPPIIFALFLHEPMPRAYRKTIQTVSYLPHFISTVAVVGILFVVLSPQGGIVNLIYVSLTGREPIYFIAQAQYFRALYVISEIWQHLGFSAIIYLAALSAIDTSLYESASMDGATRTQQMLRISIPGILPTIIILLILSIGRLMNVSLEKVLLMQLPATYEVSDVLGTYVYRLGLTEMRYSYAAAVGFFNSLINVILIIVANTLAKRMTDYSLW